MSSITKIFEELNTGHAKNFDPVRFAYIQSLFKRLETTQHEANSTLVEKAQASVEGYLADLSNYRQQAKPIFDDLSVNHKSHLETAQALFEQCQFKQLEKLSTRLKLQQKGEQSLTQLRGLVNDINQTGEVTNDDPVQLSIDDMLRQQEQNARDLPHDNVDGSGEQLVMQSMKHFRESMKHFNIDKIISRAINEGPENPGPLNPQMLAIKSLTHMRDLSPPYLRRFANYIETLLWLEKNATKLNNTNKH